MRTIDAGALKRKVQRLAIQAWKMQVKASAETILNQFIDYIDHAPTVDAVQVIRCGFCRYYNSVGYCALHQTEMSKTDFCSYGKKDDDHAEGIVQKERS